MHDYPMSLDCIDSFMSMFHLMDKRVPLVQNSQSRLKLWQKTHPKCIKNVHRGNHKSNIISGRSSEPTLREGHTPSHAFPFPPDHFQRRGAGPDRIDTVPNLGKTLAFSNQKYERN